MAKNEEKPFEWGKAINRYPLTLSSVTVLANKQKIWNITRLQFEDTVTTILKIFSGTDSTAAVIEQWKE